MSEAVDESGTDQSVACLEKPPVALFSSQSVPPKKPLTQDVTLVVSYTGLDSQQIMVRVLPGQVNTHDVALSSGIYTMDALVVADVREGNALAITQQRNAPNVKNVAATDAFGNIADGNAAEMLRLLPGMAAENTESESRFMMIRGIDANLNSVTFDGMKLASGGSGSERQTGMSEIPLGTVEYMEVTKSPTPDMDGDSIGGTINMRPASVFDRTNPRRITYAFSVSGRATGSFPGAGAFTSRMKSWPVIRRTNASFE